MKQRGKNGQSIGSVMRMCKFWRTSLGNEELKKLEEALPRLKECDLEKVSHGKGQEWDVTASTRKFPGFDTRNEGRNRSVSGEGGKWPQQACTTMFLIPNHVTSERPIALMTTLIRWWEALRAPGVAK